ncbi:2-oxo-4-hydroxy-4-carboxy-5-ureidoimidazoline decarboxylase [Agromyces italicus]|uniref:2-oxo-4-hydroxy-4-carboxy-5-ureidoimidazoline decarboxylase n=1 Tax=Agromyces italicus TaxID=279572 RepID=UPI0003B54CE9|nr:2-oxo-4-hydroxy-4-carboxy-5-ureidoimidazoline decarboxylase [Agromyces italicus]
MLLEQFNEADRAEAIAVLRPCVDVTRWCEHLADHRPYRSIDELVDEAEAAESPFTAEEVAQALSHHPRIGERASGQSTEATLSRAEQAGLGQGDAELARAIAEGNAAYEARFGRVFLIRAAGRSAPEILDALTERLDNDEASEDVAVAQQLREIAVLRLKGLISR